MDGHNIFRLYFRNYISRNCCADASANNEQQKKRGNPIFKQKFETAIIILFFFIILSTSIEYSVMEHESPTNEAINFHF